MAADAQFVPLLQPWWPPPPPCWPPGPPPCGPAPCDATPPWEPAALWDSVRPVRDVAPLWTVDPWKPASRRNPAAPPWVEVAPNRGGPPRAAANRTASA